MTGLGILMRAFRGMIASAFVCLMFVATPGLAQSPPSTEAIHTDLRALRDRVIAAIKDRKPDALLAEVTDDIAFTAMDNVPVHGKAEARAYYDRMMSGASSVVQDMNVTIEPDIISNIHSNGTSAISTGNSVASFKLRGGLEFSAPLRWTASLVNDGNGWKVASAHFSANMFDSPLKSALEKYIYPLLGAAAVAGLILGWLIGRVRRRA